jgi:8-oxo-dGTP pyrophosphatase MutT (NUDIX family)
MKNTPEFSSKLKEKLTLPLPGKEAQYAMAHIGRSIIDVIPEAGTFRKAAVMMLIFPKECILHTVLIQRTADNYAHSRQVSFPGGGVEQQDQGELHLTALRETMEEIGIDVHHVEVVGQLSQIYIPISKNMVYPFIGLLNEAPTYQIDPKEVEYVIETPLSHLLDESTIKRKDLTIPGGLVLQNVPYFDIQEHTVWGATAMILSEFKALMCNE